MANSNINLKDLIINYMNNIVAFYNGEDDREFIKNINLIYNEMSLQHSLGIYLRDNLENCAVLFERNIKNYCPDETFCKAEIDIVICDENNEHYAIELKVPLNGETTEETKGFITDIAFMEQVKNKAGFARTFALTVTSDKSFWRKELSEKRGRPAESGLYKYFREPVESINNKLSIGNIQISGDYTIEWKDLSKNDGKYYLIETK